MQEVQQELGIDLTLLSKIENGKRLPTIEQLQKLSKFYNGDFDGDGAEELLCINTASGGLVSLYDFNTGVYNCERKHQSLDYQTPEKLFKKIV